jgi:antirestriction protein ArdC
MAVTQSRENVYRTITDKIVHELEHGMVLPLRHADYVGSWLEVLREDARAIVKAASLASIAADYILQFQSQSVEAAA